MYRRLLAFLLTALWSSHSLACWNSMRTGTGGVNFQASQPEMMLLTFLPEDNPAVSQLLSTAERALEAGHHWDAFTLLNSSYLVKLDGAYSYAHLAPSPHPDLESIRPDPLIDTDSTLIKTRFERIVAVITMRLHRNYGARSLAVFQRQLKDEPQSIYLKARIAEAHALLGDKHLARSILEALEAADLLPDGEASRLLVCLRQGCKPMSKQSKGLPRTRASVTAR